MNALRLDEIEAICQREQGWTFAGGKITREWAFPDFVAAMRFVNLVAVLAEQAGHHPDIDIRYNVVRLALVTHDAGGITSADAAMAARLNQEFPPEPQSTATF